MTTAGLTLAALLAFGWCVTALTSWYEQHERTPPMDLRTETRATVHRDGVRATVTLDLDPTTPDPDDFADLYDTALDAALYAAHRATRPRTLR